MNIQILPSTNYFPENIFRHRATEELNGKNPRARDHKEASQRTDSDDISYETNRSS
ncbi:hypothetical protein Tco_1373929, partial [Tanacetum coccineum]